jgi:beta-1,4-mannosyltransferase
MQYHALSIANSFVSPKAESLYKQAMEAPLNKTKEGADSVSRVQTSVEMNEQFVNEYKAFFPKFNVDIVGYPGAKPHITVRDHLRIKQFHLKPPFVLPRSKLLFLLLAPFKVLYQCINLFQTLCSIPKPEWILVQNPPSIPTLIIAKLVCILRGSKLAVDWHNLGFSILGLTLGSSHPLVKMSFHIERWFGRTADAHMCVTKAMQQFLLTWGIQARVLYDRPPKLFQPISLDKQHKLFLKLEDRKTLKFHTSEPLQLFSSPTSTLSTMFTYFDDQSEKYVLRQDRPALIVTSTSWTEDEDFALLADALAELDRYQYRLNPSNNASSARNHLYSEKESSSVSTSSLPNTSSSSNTSSSNTSSSNKGCFPSIVCVVTGNGPLKEHWQSKFQAMNLEHIHIATAWLEAEDYPVLLGSADVGISLHTSSSGLDLPMKVVDMFGVHLPVCAVDFKCLNELVQHAKNGYVFNTSQELASQITHLLGGFPNQNQALMNMRQHIKNNQLGWDDNWNQVALPVFQSK